MRLGPTQDKLVVRTVPHCGIRVLSMARVIPCYRVEELPCSLFPVPCSLLPDPCSLSPVPRRRLPPYSHGAKALPQQGRYTAMWIGSRRTGMT
jgi:hypothetical protein